MHASPFEQSWLRFLAIGLLVAALEEFVTQGVLKHTLAGWIVPTLIAFGPFVLIVRAIGHWALRWLEPWRAMVVYYVAAGTLGLAVEWFLIGLVPWKNPNILQVPFQLGMMSFWIGVAFAPVLLLDCRKGLESIRMRYRNWLVFAFGVVYAITWLSPPKVRFAAVIIAVLVMFLSLNVFYVQYVCSLKRSCGVDDETDGLAYDQR